MKLALEEKRLLKKITKRIDQKSYIGIIVVHYSKTTKKNGIGSCVLLADSLKGNTVKRNVPCSWGVLKLFK